MTRFKVGDIIVNPWVSILFNGDINPIYANVYIGHDTTIDYLGRTSKWSQNGRWHDKDKWRVIGQYDIYGEMKKAIIHAIQYDDESIDKYFKARARMDKDD